MTYIPTTKLSFKTISFGTVFKPPVLRSFCVREEFTAAVRMLSKKYKYKLYVNIKNINAGNARSEKTKIIKIVLKNPRLQS